MYYRTVLRLDPEHQKLKAAQAAHRFARRCPPPQMTAGVAIAHGLTVVGPDWFWKSPAGTDRHDAAQDEAIALLEVIARR